MILDRARFTLWIAVAFAVLLALVAWSFSVGRFPVAAGDVASALWAALDALPGATWGSHAAAD